ncbi:Outward-rectifier potassium channel TOK1 [Madurella mycetomatis]|uniref:Outward-rectifier potassium channel TOK1 n=1 Tax=Madurella mycetomatis TaxID=100816 RepID=A0A150ASP2_9PEZI|nr:Outward-rectifier potassium channel TOK1 [Madurella mycetomatis]
MNDASGECIDKHIRAVEPDGTKPLEPLQYDHTHLDPSRWWFASSAFPMIAGTLGPVASAFSICALVRPWRQSLPPGTDIDSAPFIADPPWLTIVNAVQLVIAIVANMALLLNMTRRLRFAIAQPVTILGWYISSVCLVALAATASGPLVIQPADEFIWSQAFYYGVYAAVLYFFVASLMVVTYLGAQTGHYPKDFVLTPSQRTLMLQTIMLLFYLLIGALIFKSIEGWNYLDGVYWATVTLFTVGFGDIYPTTTLGRALLMPYALVGIISLGLVIGSIRSLAVDRGRRRLDARILEKKRRKMLRTLTLKGKDGVLVPIKDTGTALAPIPADSGLTEFERREQEFRLMRKIQEVAAQRRRWFAMAVSTGTWLVLWLAGARVFQECEERYQGWTYFDGFYFASVSLTTIGYGDKTPVSNAGKSFWVFWALLALPTMTVLISNAGDTIVKGIREATDQIATVTILPGEHGFKKDFKLLLRTLSCGILFQEETEQSPTGFLGDTQDIDPSSGNENDIQDTAHQDEADLEAEGSTQSAATSAKLKRAQSEKDEEAHAKEVEAIIAGATTSIRTARPKHRSRAHSASRRQFLAPVPSTKPDYHITLIDEIGRIMRHLKHKPPRKYSFYEWAWYLRLIGEDEADAGKHRKANPHVKGKKADKLREGSGAGTASAVEGQVEVEGESSAWSWVGSRSPLMGTQEEAEWILERLIARLGEELREVRAARERLEKEAE